jgi:hypothetical protein
MKYHEWNESIKPKVQGSWNLHRALPSGMEFFIMLSSVTGIVGNPGQSNYASGNCFQDALARHRIAQGEKATALDLGIILGEGFVAENKEIHDKLVRMNLLDSMSQKQLFALFDYYCDPSRAYTNEDASQIVCSLAVPGALLQKGVEIPIALSRSLFRGLHQIDYATDGTLSSQAASASHADMETVFKKASSLQEAGLFVAEALREKLCKILGIDMEDRTVEDRMESFGVDSLVALELRNWIAREMKADVAAFEILGEGKVRDIGMLVARKSAFNQAVWEEGE